jgi:hypothetical protein
MSFRNRKLEEMLNVAELAGKGIDFVRVDIHDSNHRPSSEMTGFQKPPRESFHLRVTIIGWAAFGS